MKTKNVNSLLIGETLITQARLVEGGKIQLEFAEIISNRDSQSAATLLNADDSRFKANNVRRAWGTYSPTLVKLHLGIEATGKEWKEINMLNPTIEGKRMRVRIVETLKGTEYDVAHPETRAKRAGKDGEFIKNNGQYIFFKNDVQVTNGEVAHIYLPSDKATVGVPAIPAGSAESFE